MSRPTKMTEIVVKKLEEAFALGCTDKEACVYACISKQTLYNYQNKNEEFLDRKELLKSHPILKARQEVVRGINGNPEFALKYLSRKKKDEFSLRVDSNIRQEHKCLTLTDLYNASDAAKEEL